jgi:hypothetical protein
MNGNDLMMRSFSFNSILFTNPIPMATTIKSFFLWCAGIYTPLLEEAQSENTKYVSIGATVFFTGVFAALAGGYALHLVFESTWISLAFGTLWGLMIFNLDRYIVNSMRKENRFFRSFKLALPRIVLAILISIVIARPLELKLFEKEIETELALMIEEEKNKRAEEISKRYEEERKASENRLNRLEKQIALKTEYRDKLRMIAQQEADGTGGSMKVNAGPIYQIKKADADKAELELAEIKERNDSLIALETLKLRSLDSKMAATIASMPSIKLSGPAARLDALSRLTTSSSAIYWVNIFILLLFILIETTPVLVKLIAPMEPYDHLLKLEEYVHEIQRAERVGVLTAKARQRIETLTDLEREYVENRLNRSMNAS